MSDKQPKNNIFDQLQEVAEDQEIIKKKVDQNSEDTRKTKEMVENLVKEKVYAQQRARDYAKVNNSYYQQEENKRVFALFLNRASKTYVWGNEGDKLNSKKFKNSKTIAILSIVVLIVLSIVIFIFESILCKTFGLAGALNLALLLNHYKCLAKLTKIKCNIDEFELLNTKIISMVLNDDGILISERKMTNFLTRPSIGYMVLLMISFCFSIAYATNTVWSAFVAIFTFASITMVLVSYNRIKSLFNNYKNLVIEDANDKFVYDIVILTLRKQNK